MRVGIISDTHLPGMIRRLDELGPEIGDFLSSVELILHSGDIVSWSVLDWCEQFAPVVAARGNHDGEGDPRVAPTQFLELAGWRIGMIHELWPESAPVQTLREHFFGGAELDIMVAGDTHVERLEYREETLILNSGSAVLPRNRETRLGTVGLLELEPGRLRAEIVVLGQTEGRPNPGVARHLEIADGRVVAASHNGAPLPAGELPPPGDVTPGSP